MNLKKVKRISDVIYFITISYAIIIVIKNYYERSILPEGVCPVDNNYEFIVFAIILLIITFIATTIIDHKYHKAAEENTLNSSEGED